MFERSPVPHLPVLMTLLLEPSLQYLVNIGVDFSGMERFFLQPVKSVLLEIMRHCGQLEDEDFQITMKGVPMAVVEEIMHMGILISSDTQETAV